MNRLSISRKDPAMCAKQYIVIATPEEDSDIIAGSKDPNQIIDHGSPEEFAVSLGPNGCAKHRESTSHSKHPNTTHSFAGKDKTAAMKK